MRTMINLAFATVVALAVPVQAQDAGEIGLFADTAGTDSTIDLEFGQGFQQVYVVALGVPDGVSAYEFSVSGLGAANVAQVSSELAGPAPSTFGGDPSGSNFIVGAGGCIADDAGATVLVTLTLVAFAEVPSDAAVCIGPASPSSFDSAGPGYVDCSDQAFVLSPAPNDAGNYPDGCLILNPSQDPVDGASSSFGQVKARF